MAKDINLGIEFSNDSTKIWRIIQWTVWIIGVILLYLLFFQPEIGELLFWNVLIPIAPALFVLATGVWRNVCPMASTVLFPRHLGWSKQQRLTLRQQGILSFCGVLLLYLLVPLRHPLLNNNGAATGWLIVGLTSIGFLLGFRYEWKSAWCSGLCPIHPVEKLYGSNVGITVPNAHCDQCRNCVIPCPDSSQHNLPNPESKNRHSAWASVLLIGGLPGFIFGWFHVPDSESITGWKEILSSYEFPLLGMAVSISVFLVWKKWFPDQLQKSIIPIFATLSVSYYYWFRIPALLGFGNYGKDGLLIDLSTQLPPWSPWVLSASSGLFFVYWILLRKKNGKSWSARPPFV